MNYLSPHEILYIHSRTIDELGGKHGVDNITVLKKLIKYIHSTEIFPDKLSKAAALFFGIAKKQFFADKNLETGILVLQMFLSINKLDIDIGSTKFQRFLKEEFSQAKLEDIRKFLLENTKEV